MIPMAWRAVRWENHQTCLVCVHAVVVVAVVVVVVAAVAVVVELADGRDQETLAEIKGHFRHLKWDRQKVE